jgi:hypothetical protein
VWRIGGVRAPRSVQGDLRERVRVHQYGLRQARHRAHASGAQVTVALDTAPNQCIPFFLMYLILRAAFDTGIGLRWAQENLGVKKVFAPLEISLEMPNYVFFPKQNNIPHFQNQRYINS